ncbi:hypothetical protein LTR36_004071 [Oleoguttula mirabilis]|uniref:Uncharacterized protein n=1 Tax=Oleoguttula mirabilis TaxID=1507867 RepID=A0AAV9JHD3_9PEZI|nr:hypothetical protein LTR36_004071 [Oleoguttula mirabilis]
MAHPATAHHIATATFKLCDVGRHSDSVSTSYDLYEQSSRTQVEIEILALLHEDGHTHFPAFHEASESCVLQRPLGDLIRIWHAEMIEGSTFCLHLHESESHADEEETDDALQMSCDADLPSSELDTLFLTPSPPHHLRDTIIFRLTFGFKDDAPIDHDLWRPYDLRVKLSTLTESLPLLIKEAAEEIAANDTGLISILLNNSHKLFLRPLLVFGDERDDYADFTRKVRVETLAELFPSTPALTTSVPVRVKVKLRVVDDDAPSDLSEAIVADTELGYQFSRLGSLKAARLGDLDDSEVPIECAIVAWVEDDGTVHLNKVQTWLINGLCLGECYTVNEVGYDISSYVWTFDYEDAENVEELCTLVRAYAESGEPEAAGEVLIAPTYSFRTYDPAHHGLSLSGWPKTGVRIAVKCVNMLRKHSGGSNIIFPAPENFQLEVESVDTAESVLMLIETELNVDYHEDGRTSSRLFQTAMYGKWQLEMWVLPQIDGETTMYKYKEGSLTQFLDSERGFADGRLYVEAHIVPRSRTR